MSQNYYDLHAADFVDATFSVDMSSLYDEFLPLLKPGASILDAGCGSGRDSKAFKDLGFRVTAFDASSEMVRLASELTGLPVRLQTFTDVKGENFDAIWTCASLLHVPMNELPRVMTSLGFLLNPGGVWFLSFKYGNSERTKEGSHFSDLNEELLLQIVEHLTGIETLKVWQTQDKRPGRDEWWLNALLKKAH